MLCVQPQSSHLHHEATADCVEGVGHNTSQRCDGLSNAPLGKEVGSLFVLEQHALRCVIQSKVGAAVHNDTLQTASQAPALDGCLLKSRQLAQWWQQNLSSLHPFPRKGQALPGLPKGVLQRPSWQRLASTGNVSVPVTLPDLSVGRLRSDACHVTCKRW